MPSKTLLLSSGTRIRGPESSMNRGDIQRQASLPRIDAGAGACEHFERIRGSLMASAENNEFPSPESSLFALRKSDLDRACTALTEAFARDPFYLYIMGGEECDPATAGFFHLFTLNYGLAYGKVFAPSPNVEGVAIWLPPGRTGISSLRSIVPGILSLKKAFPLRAAKQRGLLHRLAEYGKLSAKIHEKHAPFPHWYLMVLGVADAFRGKGFAGRLLRPVLNHLDSRGLPCYLETHNPANPPLYEHFGFKIMEVARLPGSDKPHWAMVRPGQR